MTGRVAVIAGASHWHAPWHCDALRTAGVTIVGAYDSDPRRAAQLLDDTGSVCADLNRLLDLASDAIVLDLLPPDASPALIEECLVAGRDLMVEKPGAVSAAALDAVTPPSTTSRTSVPFINRYADFWVEFDRRVRAPDDWEFAHFRIHGGPPDRYVRDGVGWVLDRRRYGGGALRNLGIHAADAVVQLARGPVRVVTASVSARLHRLAVDDLATATLETVDGRRITIEAGYSMPTEMTTDKEWRVAGRGWAISEHNGELIVRDETGTHRRDAATSASQYARYGRELASIGAGVEPVADFGDLRAAAALVDRIYAAAACTSCPLVSDTK